MKVLLDTHVLLWWVQGSSRLPRRHRNLLKRGEADPPVYVSDISLWEVVVLCERRRIELNRPLREWLECAVAPPLVERVGISPAIAAEVAALPADFHRDPADRILVATARVIGARLMTLDERIIESGVVQVV